MFQGSGRNFKVFGFEYWSDSNDPTSGYVEWIVDGSPSHRMGAAAIGPDPENQGGSGIGQRLVPLEPMSIILNLGISRMLFPGYSDWTVPFELIRKNLLFFPANWQTIDPSTMIFPSEYLIDYVRVYQRKDQVNIGCDPQDFPTAKYINDHLEAYMGEFFFKKKVRVRLR